MTNSQIVPHSREAEEALLGAILINPKVYHPIADFLQPGDFYIHRHRYIWEAVKLLSEKKKPVDFLTLTDELERAGHLEEVGGSAYVTSLIQNTPTSLHAEAYAHIVEEHAIRRRMLEAANLVAKLAYQEEATLNTLVEESEQAVFQAAERLQRRDLRPLASVLSDLYDAVESNAQSGQVTGIPTGFSSLDNLLEGLQPADLLIVAGRPGVGKTAFLLDIARHAALQGARQVAVFSLEMSERQLGLRWIAQRSGIPGQRLRSGQLREQEWFSFTQALEGLAQLRVYVDDTPALTPGQLRARCKILHAQGCLDLIVLDYLQLMAGGGRFENRQQEVSYISRQLKALAKELNVPVLAAAQLSRAVEQRLDKEPVLSDLRESGALEQNADVVIFLYRPDDKTGKERVQVTVAKHRNGPTGRFQLRYRPELTRFEDWSGSASG